MTAPTAPDAPTTAPATEEERAPLDPVVVDVLKAAIQAIQDRKGAGITVLDVAGRTSICDAIVLVTGSHARHVSAIADGIVRVWKDERGGRPLGVEGQTTGRWVLIDLGDVVVHIFDGPMRGYYDLDGLWLDARKVPLEELGLEPDPEGADDDWMLSLS